MSDQLNNMLISGESKCGLYLHHFQITFGVAPSGSGWRPHVNVGAIWKVVLIEAFVAEGTLAVPAFEVFAVLVPADNHVLKDLLKSIKL
jgi:hypothetical protein